MARTSDPTYVTGSAPSLKIQPPIEHPAWCVCRRCSNLPEDERGQPHTFRIYRASKFPASLRDSIIYAADVKREVERELAESVRPRAPQDATHPRLDLICAAYLHHQERDGKRVDRNRYTVAAIEGHFGSDADPGAITKSEHAAWVEALRSRGLAPDTIGRHTRILLAILNSAVRDGLIPSHQLHGVRRPIVRKMTKPVTFTRRQLEVLRGPAMDRWESELRHAIDSFKPETGQHPPTPVPLRGFCLIAYRTLMRPGNNFGLEWSQLTINERKKTGRFRLQEHKNVSRGIEVEGALHRELVEYLAVRRTTANGSRFVHPNPRTGAPYVNITTHWKRLCEIANEILHAEGSEDLRDERLHFYTWRHTGASRLAESGADPVMIVRMMGDVDLETVREHYFDSSLEHMQRMMDRWE